MQPGHKEVMLIHTHYSHLSEMISVAQEPSLKHQDKAERLAHFIFYVRSCMYLRCKMYCNAICFFPFSNYVS